MQTYITFYFIQLGAIIIARAFGLRDNKYLLLVLITLATCFAGLRGEVGTDVIAYRTFYNEVGLQDREVVFEPFFLTISLLGNALGFPSQFLIFSVAALQGIFIYLALKQIVEKDTFYLIFVATFFVYLQMNTIRVGLALCITAYALVLNDERKRSAISIFVLSILTHVTAAFALPLFSKRWYRAIPIAIIVIIIFQNFFLSKLVAYFIGENIIRTENDFVGIGFLLSLVIIAYCITVEKKWEDRKIRISFFTFGLFKIAIPLFPAFDRISLIFSVPLFVLLLRTRVTTRTRFALFLIVAYGIYGSLSFIANSDASVETLIAENPGFALLYANTHWLPYEFFWK